MRDVNQDTFTGTLSWYKILLLSGFNFTRVKQNLHMRRKKAYHNSWNRRKQRTLYKQTTRWNLGKRVKVLSWNHRTSAPHRSETNGIAERAVRRAKEGTSAVLLQSGLDERWWSDSMECYCYLRNIQDILGDGKNTLWKTIWRIIQRANNTASSSDWIPLDFSKRPFRELIHQFGKKVLPGIFLGYELIAGGIWKGDILTADLEDLEKLDASDIYSRRINAKEVLKSQKGEEFIFPEADCTAKLSGRGYEFLNPLQGGNKPQGAKISVEDFKANPESLNGQNQQMPLKSVPIFGRS